MDSEFAKRQLRRSERILRGLVTVSAMTQKRTAAYHGEQFAALTVR